MSTVRSPGVIGASVAALILMSSSCGSGSDSGGENADAASGQSSPSGADSPVPSSSASADAEARSSATADGTDSGSPLASADPARTGDVCSLFTNEIAQSAFNFLVGPSEFNASPRPDGFEGFESCEYRPNERGAPTSTFASLVVADIEVIGVTTEDIQDEFTQGCPAGDGIELATVDTVAPGALRCVRTLNAGTLAAAVTKDTVSWQIDGFSYYLDLNTSSGLTVIPGAGLSIAETLAD